jgi:hypothetical protein
MNCYAQEIAMRWKVEFEVTTPDDLTLGQAEEWLLFVLSKRGSCSNENPMVDTDLSAERVRVTSGYRPS